MPVQLVLGGHTLSGACLEPRALNELIPDWKDKGVREIFELMLSDNNDIPYRKHLICVRLLRTTYLPITVKFRTSKPQTKLHVLLLFAVLLGFSLLFKYNSSEQFLKKGFSY